MLDIMHRGDLTQQEFAAINEQYVAHISSMHDCLSDDKATLADSIFHDCAVVSAEKSVGDVRIILEGRRFLRSTGQKLRGTHQLIFGDGDLTIVEPLHDPDYWLYEEVSREGPRWVYSAILDSGQLEVRFRDCDIASSRPLDGSDAATPARLNRDG